MIDSLEAINDNWIQKIDDYHFPVVTLSDETEADALCPGLVPGFETTSSLPLAAAIATGWNEPSARTGFLSH